jgi:hypothetical protein
MARTRVLEALGVEADERAATDAYEPIEQLPLPTLDERASIYLRAIHGDRDFTSAEHANARELILEAMAADIAANGITTRDVTTRDVTREAVTRDIALDSHSPNVVLQDLEPITVPGLAGDLAGDLSGDRRIDQRDDEPEDIASEVSRQVPVFSQRQRHSFLSEARLLYGLAAVCSAAIFAATLGYWAGTLSQSAQSTPNNSRLTVQVPPSNASGQLPPGSDPRVVAEAQRELESVLNVARLGPDEVAALLKEGRQLVALGKFRFARLLLEQAAEAKNASAAFTIGQTYDPLIERSAARPDAPPDLAMARVWYEKAKDLGSVEAAQRLSQLLAATPVPAPRPAPR